MKTTNPIKNKICEIVKESFGNALSFEPESAWIIEETKDSKFGEYSTNIAMIEAKKLKQNPKEVANKIVSELQKSSIFTKVEIAGPGFINFFIDKSFYISILKEITDNKKFFQPNVGNNQKLVIEYSQPNIAKPLGVHHLLSTIIGQSLVNIHEYLNFDVIKVNHIGDWGTQFGKLIYAYKTWGEKEVIEKHPIAELLKLYVKFHNEAELDKDLEDKGRAEFKKLENKDTENVELWKWIREISLDEVKATYNKLGGITFEDKDYIGESFYNDKMDIILEEGKNKGIFKKSEGAYIAEIDDNTPPLLVQKNDGTTLYATRDLAQVRYRSGLGIMKNMMVVDVAQSLHFKQFFHVAKKLGYNKGDNGEITLEHIIFGRMQLPDKQMSTRKGNVILLDNLLDEAVDRAKSLIDEINPNLNEDEKKSIAKSSGIGAVKYNVLSQNRIHNITFHWDQMISLDGNCAPYLQYTHARTKSVLRNNDRFIYPDFEITEDIELKLLKTILDFPDSIIEAQQANMPHFIATYMYKIASTYNKFYNSCQILKTEGKSRNLRLKLTEIVSDILKKSLHLLVIEAPDKM